MSDHVLDFSLSLDSDDIYDCFSSFPSFFSIFFVELEEIFLTDLGFCELL